MTTRTKLASDLTEWLQSADVSSAIIFDSLLRITEARIKRKIWPREREITRELNLIDQRTDLPSDYVKLRALTLDSQLNRQIDYYTPESLRKSPIWINGGSFSTGQPQGFTIEGNQLVLAPAPTEDAPVKVFFIYHAYYEKLTSGAATNWLLQEHYDIYLWSMLQTAAIQQQDSELETKYKSELDAAVLEFNRAANRARFPRATALRTIGSAHAIV